MNQLVKLIAVLSVVLFVGCQIKMPDSNLPDTVQPATAQSATVNQHAHGPYHKHVYHRYPYADSRVRRAYRRFDDCMDRAARRNTWRTRSNHRKDCHRTLDRRLRDL